MYSSLTKLRGDYNFKQEFVKKHSQIDGKPYEICKDDDRRGLWFQIQNGRAEFTKKRGS